MKDIHLNLDFVWHVTKSFLQNEDHSDKVADIFSIWYEANSESLEDAAKKVNVSVDDLCGGDIASAMKVLMESEDPYSAMDDELNSPVFRLRSKLAKPHNPDVFAAFKDAGLEFLVQNLTIVDLSFSTPNLVEAVSRVLELYGFVNVETFWEASCRPPSAYRTRFNNFKEVISPVILPYDDSSRKYCKYISSKFV